MYTIHMLEGSDELIGKYFQLLSTIADDLYEKSKVVLVYNNVNQVMTNVLNWNNIINYLHFQQRFLEKIVWRFANLPEVSDVTLNREHNISTLLKKMYYLFRQIKEEEADEGTSFKSYYLATEFEEYTPDEKLLDYVLGVDDLQTIQEFASMYGDCSSMLTFVDEKWPIAHDNMPSNVFDWGKYDVNLTFGGGQLHHS